MLRLMIAALLLALWSAIAIAAPGDPRGVIGMQVSENADDLEVYLLSGMTSKRVNLDAEVSWTGNRARVRLFERDEIDPTEGYFLVVQPTQGGTPAGFPTIQPITRAELEGSPPLRLVQMLRLPNGFHMDEAHAITAMLDGLPACFDC